MKNAERAFESRNAAPHISYRYSGSFGSGLPHGETDSFDVPVVTDEFATCELTVEMGSNGFFLEVGSSKVPDALQRIREYCEEMPTIEDEIIKLDEELALWQDELRRSKNKDIPEVQEVGELNKKVEEIKNRKQQLIARSAQLKASMEDLKLSA